MLKDVTRVSASARTARTMTLSPLSKLVKPRGKYSRNHSKGRDATAGRIRASKTIAFVTKEECTAIPSYAPVKAVSTGLVLQSQLLPNKSKTR